MFITSPLHPHIMFILGNENVIAIVIHDLLAFSLIMTYRRHEYWWKHIVQCMDSHLIDAWEMEFVQIIHREHIYQEFSNINVFFLLLLLLLLLVLLVFLQNCCTKSYWPAPLHDPQGIRVASGFEFSACLFVCLFACSLQIF